jgi:hypothetical protein
LPPRLAHDERVSDPEGAADAVATDRLILRKPRRTDLSDLFALYADPRVWGPDPLTRHDTIEQTDRMVDNWCAAWRRDGLGMWSAYGADNTFVGIGAASSAAVSRGISASAFFPGFGDRATRKRSAQQRQPRREISALTCQ